MLQFKQHQDETEEFAPRWNIGIDRRQVIAYVGLALIAGFAAGFIASKYLSHKETVPPPPLVTESRPPTRAGAIQASSDEFHRVTRIVRADAIEVEGVGTVRLLGIETPDGKAPKEIYGVHGQRAVTFAEKMMLGQEVRLEFDTESSANPDSKTQAYVYTRDGTLVNSEMVKQGFAFVRGTEQFRLANEFRGFERDAMQAMRGVWGSSSSSSTLASAPPSTSPLSDEKQKKLAPLPPSAFGANIPALSGSPSTPLEASVWVSPSDKMYHKSGCEFLDKKKRSIPLSQAKSEGFGACSRCYASTVIKAP
jgi:micrococcal nuclease